MLSDSWWKRKTASCAVTLLRVLVQLVAVAEPSVSALVLVERIATPSTPNAQSGRSSASGLLFFTSSPSLPPPPARGGAVARWYSMGVSGLTSFVTAKIVPASLRVSATAVTTTQASPIRLLVDGSGLLHELYASGGLDAAHGGQYVQFERLIVDYVRRCRRAGIELEVALDGLRPASKHATCLQRREREQQRCAEQWRFLASAASAAHSPFNNGLATLNQSSASTLPLFALVRCRSTSLHQMIAH